MPSEPTYHHRHRHIHQKKRPATHSVRERTVVVFDWDDTLCPSSWLHAQDLLPKYRGQQIQLTDEQKKILIMIGDNVARLLKKAVSYGPVFVVTAAEFGWVELSCALYLPGVKAILDMADIHIVSARSWYEQTFGVGGDSSSWKHEVMQLIARKCFGNATLPPDSDSVESPESYFNFVSVGDSMAERDACHSAVDHVPYTFAKTLKFVEQPTTEEIVQQVELTHDSFEQMCGWGSNLDLRLTRSQLAELRCCVAS
ncbi:hypothetical protein Poli38472_006091 [Pythium oligandrum]|uniref:Protein kinase n=1 Tax=Pythium oligandrum TaxID=41045 RepID=A0A8K1FSK0_PYTOL|nr:hypothetical protein Poli38472_006091 [Pythium oligandrum]|eukprot:TMW68623.1 hypothetical protein Poli38472_006091 [Pythium oligandrum]